MIEHHTTVGEADDQLAGEPYTEAMAAVVERFAADLTQAGMQRMASRVFACLLISHEPTLSSAALARRLQISPAAISGAVRYLAQVHLISREREPGSRRERYRLHHDIWYEAIADRDTVLARWIATMRAGIEVVGEHSPAGERLTDTAEFLEFLASEFDAILTRWKERGAGR
ncbi:GbsR/MarR family transcriptional regulator [Streptomyces johnsoniae]|uniref:Helix-turn-helix domain-containing protein n=1 Tax=Streptomyces johnsoniae TaxID=3075532 RepID=A0ABU2S7Y1_9ACTN|nr:helix-turn-helix domain-containing protein [Streptomyces sp. DSM 41886]MDT0445088.1 helix-turn-helix domain-containing protein [Streptomyces sp. DSM 41886]